MAPLLDLEGIFVQLSIIFVQVVFVVDVGAWRDNCIHDGHYPLFIFLLEHSESIYQIIGVGLQLNGVPRKVSLQALTQCLLIIAKLRSRLKLGNPVFQDREFAAHFCGTNALEYNINKINQNIFLKHIL